MQTTLIPANFWRNVALWSGAVVYSFYGVGEISWVNFIFPALPLFMLPFRLSGRFGGFTIFKRDKDGIYWPPIYGDGGLSVVNQELVFRAALGPDLKFPLSSLVNLKIELSSARNPTITMEFHFLVGDKKEMASMVRGQISLITYSSPPALMAKWKRKVPYLQDFATQKILGGEAVLLERPYAELHLGKLSFRLRDGLEVNGQRVNEVTIQSATGKKDFLLLTPQGKALACSSRNSDLLEHALIDLLLAGGKGFPAVKLEEPANFYERDIFKIFRRNNYKKHLY